MIHQSANRPNLLLGGDRELVLVMVMIAGGLAFSLASWWGIGLAVALWIGSMGALQRMGKADPLLRPVYLRHIRYAEFYPSEERSSWSNYRNAEWLEVTAAMQITEHRSRARGLADLLLPFALDRGRHPASAGRLITRWLVISRSRHAFSHACRNARADCALELHSSAGQRLDAERGPDPFPRSRLSGAGLFPSCRDAGDR